MGVWSWLILLAWSAAIATFVQYAFFKHDRKPNDYDWVYTAGGGLLGAFTAHAWYPGFGPVVGGLNLLQALAGGIAGAAVLEVVYRFYIRPRQPV
jgi:cytochrome c biogenesis protein CcdA